MDTVSIKVSEVKKLIAKLDDWAKYVVGNDDMLDTWKEMKVTLKSYIKEAKANGFNKVTMPATMWELFEAMSKIVDTWIPCDLNKDNIGHFHPDTEKALRRYTKLTKWRSTTCKSMTKYEKMNFALYLAYLFEYELYNNDFNKRRRKTLHKKYKDKLNQEVLDDVIAWACEKGYCEDRLSDTIGGYLKTIGPNPTVLKGLFKKKKKAA